MSANDPERTSFHASAVREAFSWFDVMMHSAQSLDHPNPRNYDSTGIGEAVWEGLTNGSRLEVSQARNKEICLEVHFS